MRSAKTTSEARRGRTEEERDYYALSERVYRVFAPFYDAVVFPARGLRRRVALLAGAGPGVHALDVATGTGAQAMAFAARGAKVVGVDLSESMLRIARRKNRLANLVFERADATLLPFPESTFDVAGISFALHEMPGSVRERVLSEIARVTRPGGTVVVVDYGLPKNRVARWVVYHAVKLFERELYESFMKEDLRARLAQAGLTVREEHPALARAARILVATR